MYKTEFSLVSWAPSLLADEESDMEDNSDLILAITHEKKVDVLSLRQVLAEGKDDCLIENITVGRKSIYDGHTKVQYCNLLSTCIGKSSRFLYWLTDHIAVQEVLRYDKHIETCYL